MIFAFPIVTELCVCLELFFDVSVVYDIEIANKGNLLEEKVESDKVLDIDRTCLVVLGEKDINFLS
jgi:hypothetical protein